MQKKLNNNRKNSNVPRTKVRNTPKTQVAPLALGTSKTNALPGEMVFAHRELVGTISYNNTATFELRGLSGTFPGYDINPGSTIMFPWLSGVAVGFEKYRFEKLKFELVPRVPATATGGVMVAIDYDWDDTPATTAVELMANRGAVAASLWQSVEVSADTRLMNQDLPWRYIENAQRRLDSQRLMYAGFLMVATTGTSASGSADLFVEYTVRLSLPALHHTISEVQTTSGVTVLAAATPTGMPNIVDVGPLKTVTLGMGGVTPLISAALRGMKALAIPGSAKGGLTFDYRPKTAGTAPSAFASDTVLSFDAIDSEGVVVGTSVDEQDTGYMGPMSGATWGVAGAEAKGIITALLSKIRSLYPTAAYILPKLYSAGGRNIDATSILYQNYYEL